MYVNIEVLTGCIGCGLTIKESKLEEDETMIGRYYSRNTKRKSDMKQIKKIDTPIRLFPCKTLLKVNNHFLKRNIMNCNIK